MLCLFKDDIFLKLGFMIDEPQYLFITDQNEISIYDRYYPTAGGNTDQN